MDCQNRDGVIDYLVRIAANSKLEIATSLDDLLKHLIDSHLVSTGPMRDALTNPRTTSHKSDAAFNPVPDVPLNRRFRLESYTSA